MFIVGDVSDDQLTLTGVCPQPLLTPAGVARDDGVGRVEDRLSGPVVLLEQNRCRVRKVAFEVLDVADRRAAERIDGLIRVTDHAQLGRRHRVGVGRPHSHQLAHQHVLGVIGVLVFVDQDVPESTPVVLGDLRERLQHGHRLADQVVEIQRVGRPQPALILGVHLGDDASQIVGRLRCLRGGLLGPDQLVLQVRDAVGQQPRRMALGVQAHVLADHQQQPARIVGVVDREVRVQPGHQRGLVAQNPHTGRVERRDPHAACPRTHQTHHPLAHLRGRLVGERDRQNLPHPYVASGQQVGDAAGEHRRLSRTGTGDDQQRASLVQHRLALLRVQPVQQLIGVARRGRHRKRCSHMRTNLPLRTDTLCAGTAGSGTLIGCSTRSPATRSSPEGLTADFSTGTGQRCPWFSCFPEPRGPLPDPGLVSCVRPETG